MESFFFSFFFCSFVFCRDRQCHGTRKCPHRLSSDTLLRSAVPSQLRVSLHAWRLPRRFKNASELWGRCSTPQHAQHAGPYTHAYQHQQQAQTQSNTPQYRTCTRRSMEEGVDGVVRARVEDASLAGSTGHGFRVARAIQPRTGLRGPGMASPSRRTGGQHLTASVQPFGAHMQKESRSHIHILELIQTQKCSKTDTHAHMQTCAFQ